jgi:hypothetical protein
MLVLVVFTDSWARSLVTVAHEGGHMVMAIITGRGYSHFYLNDGGGGGTRGINTEWGIGDMAVTFVGYPMPCILGLGGAAVIRHGQTWSVLLAALILLLVAFFQAGSGSVEGGPLAQAVVLLAFLGVGWVALNGGPYLQVVVAVGLVWWMLIGGAYWASVGLSRGEGSDAAVLARTTLIPGVVWHVLWALIGTYALLVGGRYLLHG